MSILSVVIIILALFCEAFFAGSETGIISTNRIKLSYLTDKGNRRARIIKGFLDNPERLLGTTLVGVNLSVIIGSSIASKLVSYYLADQDLAPLITTLIMLPLILIFGEILPKAISRQYADFVSLYIAYPLKISSIVLFPFIWIATKISSFVFKIFGKGEIKKTPYVTREELRLLFREGAKEGLLTKDKIKMAYEIFDFWKTNVNSVMIPLNSVVSASYLSRVEELKELIAQSGYSRLPIYKDKPENIIGTVQVSDFVSGDTEDKNIRDIIRQPYVVGENKPISELLKDFQTNQKNIAIVTTSQNQAIGIATLEDVVEEIVGEIEDEYDTVE